MKTLLIGLGILVFLYLAAALGLYAMQRRLIYRPDTAYLTPVEAGLTGVTEKRLEAPDGVSLIAWQAKAEPGRPTLLYFHGNAGGLTDRAERIKRFAREGYGVFMPAYRGYSGSTGSPTEAAIVADARLAYDYLIGQGVAPERLVLYGESLGTGVAVQLADSRKVAGVILDSPYTSLADIGRALYPFMPVGLFMIDTFATIDHIARINAPLLILHGSQDTVVPPAMSEKLYAAALEPKRLVVVPGAGHSDIYAFGALAPVTQFIVQTIPRTTRTPASSQ